MPHFTSHRYRASALLTLLLASTMASACSRASRTVRTESTASGEVEIESGVDVLANMHQRYAARIPNTVALEQTNTVYTASGRVAQKWRVLVDPPSRMRVDFLPLARRSGVLYKGRQAITVVGGRRVAEQVQPNPALLFGYSVFAHSPDSTRRLLEALGIDVRRVRQDEFNGSKVWVIGARAGDLTSNQLWVSANRLLPLRHISRERRDGTTVVTDTRFGAYRAFDGFPLASVVRVYRNGKLALRQEVTRARLGVPIPAAAFDDDRWAPVAVKF